MLQPHDVFTPGRPPIEPSNVYARRGQKEDDFRKSLERSQVPVVFGEFGTGKTSLARHCVLDAQKANCLVNVESVDGKTLSDVLRQVLEHLGYTVTKSLSRQTDNGGSVKGTAGVQVPFTGFAAQLALEGSLSSKSGSGETREIVVTSPSDSKILSLCEEAGLVLILDELHRADRTFVANLSSLVKAFSNKPCRRFKIILLGTASDTSRIVDHDPGVDRIIQEIHLPAMSDEEATFVVKEGMRNLKIEVDRELVAQVVRTCVGSPALVQYLSLEIAELAFKRSPRAAEPGDFKHALDNYMRKKAARMNAAYLKAIETTGPKRYRKQILHAMSQIEDEYVTMEQLVEQISAQLKEDTPRTTLSGPLRDLKTTDFGSILKDVERHEGGERVFNYTTFADPAMKAFIRMRYVGEKEGIL